MEEFREQGKGTATKERLVAGIFGTEEVNFVNGALLYETK